MNDMELLQRYANGGSETAFKEIVDRHVNLVYSAALRQVRDASLAEDISQAVFLTLAKKAGKLSSRTILSGWLYRTTQFAASRALRSELRRKHREQEAYQMQTAAPDRAWEQLAPHLDDAMAQLGDTDRNAVVLRYFENKDLHMVGEALGVSEDAAQKRLSRALEKLRRIFSKRQVAVTTTIVASVISSRAVASAPRQLGSAIAATSTGQAVVSPAIYEISKETLRRLFWPKMLQGTLVAVCIGIVALVVIENFSTKDASDDLNGDAGVNNLSAPKKKIRNTAKAQSSSKAIAGTPFPVQTETTTAVAPPPIKPRIVTNAAPPLMQKPITPVVPISKTTGTLREPVAAISPPEEPPAAVPAVDTNNLPEIPVENAAASSYQPRQSGGGLRVISVKKVKR